MQYAPAVILVNTQMPENIGASARACMNFGLSDLRLVAPRDEWPNKRAYDLAGHASPILDAAKVYATARDAVKDFGRVYAATARSREMIKPALSPVEAMERIRDEAVPTAILFGPERTGLTNEDVALADAIITIPTADALSSLNIGQSVVVMAYQWIVALGRQAGNGTTGPEASQQTKRSTPATKETLNVFYDHLERLLDEVDFWKVDDKKQKMWLNLRSIFARNDLTEQEVRSLHGVIASLRSGR